MNNDPQPNGTPQPDETWETTVREIARDFSYPPTPDIARRVSQRLGKPNRPAIGVLKWAVAILLALTVVVASVPQVRAFVAEVIRIGAIQIFVGQPTVVPTMKPAATGTATSQMPTTLHIDSALDLPNETTLEDAIQQLHSSIALPSYPNGSGRPNHVYVQQFNPGVLVTLLWMKPDAPKQVWFMVDILNEQLIANKFIDNDGQYHNVYVNGTAAQWLTGIHQIGFFGNNLQLLRQVNGNVLIWLVGQYGKLTYRLEGDISQDEAIRIAESMHAVGTP